MNKPTGIVNIRGKDYLTVARRVSDFRALHPTHSIVTEILDRNDDVVVMRCAIADESGRVLSTGHAEEWRKSSEINRTSAIENAETSAIGRALAALGLGGTEFASADEIEIALRKQQVDQPRPNTARQVAQDAFDKLSPEAQQVCREHALEVIAMVEEGRIGDAVAWIDKEYSDHDDRLALWSQLPANVRAAIKKAKEQ